MKIQAIVHFRRKVKIYPMPQEKEISMVCKNFVSVESGMANISYLRISNRMSRIPKVTKGKVRKSKKHVIDPNIIKNSKINPVFFKKYCWNFNNTITLQKVRI